MPLIDVSLLFTPISLMICVTSFSGTWVESHESLMSCRGWWAVSDAGCVLQSLQRGADCRLQAPLQAGVSRTRDTVATATHWRPCPREWLAPGDRGNNQYQSLNPHLNCQTLNLSIGLALLISLLYLFITIEDLDIHPWVPPSVHRKERGPGPEQSSDPGSFSGVQRGLTRSVGPSPVWAVSTVSLPPSSYSLRLNQDNPANYETGMRFKWAEGDCETRPGVKL